MATMNTQTAAQSHRTDARPAAGAVQAQRAPAAAHADTKAADEALADLFPALRLRLRRGEAPADTGRR